MLERAGRHQRFWDQYRTEGFHGIVADPEGQQWIVFTLNKYHGPEIIKRPLTENQRHFYSRKQLLAQEKSKFRAALEYRTQEQDFHEQLKINPMLQLILDRREVDRPGLARRLTREEVLKAFSHSDIHPFVGRYRQMIDPLAAQLDYDYVTSDGKYLYCFRGDYENSALSQVGIWSGQMILRGMTLEKLLHIERGIPNDFLSNDKNRVEQEMSNQANGGLGPFVSTTTRLNIAKKHPGYQEEKGYVYILKVAVNKVIRNYRSHLSSESEMLVIDGVFPDEIVAAVPKNSPAFEELQQYITPLRFDPFARTRKNPLKVEIIEAFLDDYPQLRNFEVK